MAINPDVWEFPCQHDIKIFGLAHHPLRERVVQIINQHVDDFDPATIRSKTSSGGKYQSLTASVNFVSKEQVEALFQALHACEEVTQTL